MVLQGNEPKDLKDNDSKNSLQNSQITIDEDKHKKNSFNNINNPKSSINSFSLSKTSEDNNSETNTLNSNKYKSNSESNSINREVNNESKTKTNNIHKSERKESNTRFTTSSINENKSSLAEDKSKGEDLESTANNVARQKEEPNHVIFFEHGRDSKSVVNSNPEANSTFSSKKSEYSNQTNNLQSEVKEPNPGVIFYDSLVENEKEYLEEIIKEAILDGQTYKGPCSTFIFWLFKQFERVKYPPASSNLSNSLEFLQNHTDVKNLFRDSTSSDLLENYLYQLSSEDPMNYEEYAVDTLAISCRSYITSNLIFFENDVIEAINNYLRSDISNEKIQFLMERIPFIMKNRNIFKQIKKIVFLQNKNLYKSNVDLNMSASLWCDAIFKGEIIEEKKLMVFKSLLRQEFDYFPQRFYDDMYISQV